MEDGERERERGERAAPLLSENFTKESRLSTTTTTATTPTTTTTSTGLAINTNPSGLSLQPLFALFSLLPSRESCVSSSPLSIHLSFLYASLSLSFSPFSSRFTAAKSSSSFSILRLLLFSLGASSSPSLRCVPLSSSLSHLCSLFHSLSLSLSLSLSMLVKSLFRLARSPATSLFRCPYRRMVHARTPLLHNMYLK